MNPRDNCPHASLVDNTKRYVNARNFDGRLNKMGLLIIEEDVRLQDAQNPILVDPP